MKKPGMRMVGACTTPVTTSAAKLAAVDDAKSETAPDEGRAAARHGSAPPPQGDGGIDDERDEQQVAELGDDRPRIRDTDGTGDDGAPQSCRWSSAVISRKFTFTPVRKFSARATSRIPITA